MADGHTGPYPSAVMHDPVWREIVRNEPRSISSPGFSAFLRRHDVGTIIVSSTQLRTWAPLLTGLSWSGRATGGVWTLLTGRSRLPSP